MKYGCEFETFDAATNRVKLKVDDAFKHAVRAADPGPSGPGAGP